MTDDSYGRSSIIVCKNQKNSSWRSSRTLLSNSFVLITNFLLVFSGTSAGGLYRGFHLAGLILYPVPVLCSGLDPIVHFRLSRLGCPPLLRSYYTICSHINLLTEQLNMFPYICCIFIWTHIDRYAIIEAQ